MRMLMVVGMRLMTGSLPVRAWAWRAPDNGCHRTLPDIDTAYDIGLILVHICMYIVCIAGNGAGSRAAAHAAGREALAGRGGACTRRFLARNGSPCLRHCGHSASVGTPRSPPVARMAGMCR
jgi:hypothetical protein